MKREATWGTAAVIAALAAIGISGHAPNTSREGGMHEDAIRKGTPVSLTKQALKPGVCTDLEDLFRAFLAEDADHFAAPDSCYTKGSGPPTNVNSALRQKTSGLKFIIATVPDPLHTHFALQFDRFAEAIQQAAQDEGFAYDSSWLPWQAEEQSFTHLSDQDEADDRKESREDQPGVILFRKDDTASTTVSPGGQLGFKDGLAVFIVGEEATSGIHRQQFEHAIEWISKLGGSSMSILGPSFSGSFASLVELLESDKVHRDLNYGAYKPRSLRIFSGSATSNTAVDWFTQLSNQENDDPSQKRGGLTNWNISFHSFVASDDEVLGDYCWYLNSTSYKDAKVAFISEDETAYGSYKSAESPENVPVCPRVLRLYYPRDISALRSAYQSQSIFNSESPQPAERSRWNLPSNLADPNNQVHDTIPSFGGGQTPLSEESVLIGIVGALKAHHSEYLVLRCSSTLDSLFLSEFFRRMYPQGRVVIVGSDLLFLREHGSTGISGITMLSTYPLMPWGQDWAMWPGPAGAQNVNATHIHRVFGADSVEGTYTAARFLLHSLMSSFSEPEIKSLDSTSGAFLPPNPSPADFNIPDYAAPFWLAPKSCAAVASPAPSDPIRNRPTDRFCDKYLRPAVWLSVLGRDSFYPVSAFVNSDRDGSALNDKPKAEPRQPWTFPLSMIFSWLVVFALVLFHAACCHWASFTAKPAFRAHFALATDPSGSAWRHRVLIAIGSGLTGTVGIVCALGTGAFPKTPVPFLHQSWTEGCVLVTSLVALCAVFANHGAALRLGKVRDKNESDPQEKTWFDKLRNASMDWLTRDATVPVLICIGVMVLSFVLYAWTLEAELAAIRVVSAYWRAMNVTSGVSPIVPFLCLLGGLYVWFWYSLHGLALFGPDRPRLPQCSELRTQEETRPQDEDVEKRENSKPTVVLRMFSQEDAADRAERFALPGSLYPAIVAAVIFFVIVVLLLEFGTPIRSSGTRAYATVFCGWLGLCFSVMLAEAWQLLKIWSILRQVLVFLDRLPLRRTLQALHGFSWGSIWKMGGNVLEVRYKLLSRQVESLNHLRKSLDDLPRLAGDADTLAANKCITALDNTRKTLKLFAAWYSENYRDPNAGNLESLDNFQTSIATLSGSLLTDILLPAWHNESRSLIMEGADFDDDSSKKSVNLYGDVPEHVRNAEELVCLPYLGFVQNMLGRIRTLVLGIISLFVSATLALAFYPFDPRNLIGGVMILLFIVLGAVICYVYADMHRNSTLSHITNTNPGELGGDFWFKLVGLGLGPVLGLLATVFPGVADFLLSWIEPSLASLK
ncbi:MAG: hypothetical protein ABSB39_07620 [Candidatus Sulfotelmatobacter sp.]